MASASDRADEAARRSRNCGGSVFEMIARMTMLSMPSTISRTVSVTRLAQISVLRAIPWSSQALSV